MKKGIVLLLLFCFCYSFTTVVAQEVKVNKKEVIEIYAKELALSLESKKILDDSFSKYAAHQIDLTALAQAVKSQGWEASLNFKFPDREAMEVEIFEHDLRSPEYQLLAMSDKGANELPRPECSTYKGYTEAGERVRLNITKELISGFIEIKGEIIFIESLSTYDKKATANEVIVYVQSDKKNTDLLNCPDNGKEEESKLKEMGVDLDKMAAIPSGSCIFVEFATDADFEFFSIFGSAPVAAAAITGTMNITEGLYFNTFGLNFIINAQIVWTTASDPYSETNTNWDKPEKEVKAAWTSIFPLFLIPRDYVFLYSGRSFSNGNNAVGGSVWKIGSICSNPGKNYGFVASTSVVVLMHELGHALDAEHDHATGCDPTNNPTVMCPSGGALVFSQTNRQRIAHHIFTEGECLLNPGTPTNTISERFETSLGSWTQVTNDDFNWTRNSGSTPTLNTGPSSAYEQSFYLYTEASGNNNSVAQIISPPYFMCLPKQWLSFGYHMDGKAMGSLRVEVTENGGASWQSVWYRAGNQTDLWYTAAINLSNYGLSTIRIRITATTGDGNTSDIAIDDIALGPLRKLEVDPSLLIFPQEGGDLTFNVSTSGNWEANISSGQPCITFNDYNGGGNQTVTVTCPANNGTAGRNGSAIISSGASTKTLTIVQAGNPPNTDPCSGPFANLPHFASFESVSLDGWTQDTDDDFNWTRDANGTPTIGTGPSSAAAGNYYMYTEGDGHTNQTANLVSRCVDLDQVPSPFISFAYHMRDETDNQMGSLKLQVSSNGGFGWYTLWTKTGDQGSGWQTATVDLSNHQSVPILIRFSGRVGIGSSSDMAIDDIELNSGVCYDEYENNNTFQDAKSTTIGNEVDYPNACLSAGDYDYYRYFHFNEQSQNNFYIRVKGSNPSVTGAYRLNVKIIDGAKVIAETFPVDLAGCDTYIELYNNAEGWIAYDDNSGTGLFSKITANLPPYVPPTQENRIAPKFELSNFPNPFNQLTTFAFSLVEESHVSLMITDIGGKIIAMPINDQFYARGNHQLEFDASNLAAGVYTYTLKTNTGLETKQMVIVR